jgi:alanine racemase
MNGLERASRVEIDLGALKDNIGVIKSMLKPGAKLMSVVKADAYGHGAKEVSAAASEAGVDYLGVAFLEEADEIRGSGIEKPIAILYPEAIERSVEAAKRGYVISVSSLKDVGCIRESLHGAANPVRYFIKTNTGMNRYGMDANSDLIESTVRATSADEGFMGFTTNLADPFNTRRDLADRQLDRFFEIMKLATRFSLNGILFSYEASGSLWENRAAEGSLVRVGLLMYGVSPNGGERFEFRLFVHSRSRF